MNRDVALLAVIVVTPALLLAACVSKGKLDAAEADAKTAHAALAATLSRRSSTKRRPSTPGMMSAAGYGEFDPIAGNDAPEGRGRNRRIEITLQPNLDELVSAPVVR
jgi:outer membrane murein-binding lipoprotein Lpp